MTLETKENQYLTGETLQVIEGAAARLESLRTKIKGTAFVLLQEFTQLLAEFTADFGYLSPLHQKFRAARENNELQTYMQLKNDAAVAGDKFVSAPAEREARYSVRELVEAEKVLEGYTAAVEQAILTSKKIIEVQMLERQQEAR